MNVLGEPLEGVRVTVRLFSDALITQLLTSLVHPLKVTAHADDGATSNFAATVHCACACEVVGIARPIASATPSTALNTKYFLAIDISIAKSPSQRVGDDARLTV